MWKFLVKNQSIEILEREVLADHSRQPEVNYMDKYIVPELEIISFDIEDIITTSDSDVLDKQ